MSHWEDAAFIGQYSTFDAVHYWVQLGRRNILIAQKQGKKKIKLWKCQVYLW